MPRKAKELSPLEVRELLPLLDRARYGIEFFEFSERALVHWRAIKRGKGVERFAAFCAFLADLARCTDYRLLSSVQMRGEDDGTDNDQLNTRVNRIMRDYASQELRSATPRLRALAAALRRASPWSRAIPP